MAAVCKAILGGAAAVACFLFGEFDLPFTTLLCFLVADFVIGVTAAIINKELDSRVAWKGFLKKVLTLLVVAVAFRVDLMMNLNGVVRIIAIYGYIGSELLSIIENLGRAGVPIPSKLLQYFIKFRCLLDGTDEKKTDSIDPKGG